MRRLRARSLLQRSAHTWPIDLDAARRPACFSGWPEGKGFAFVLTHDVESPKGLKNVSKIIEVEKSLGFRSCFNFVAGDYQVPSTLISAMIEDGFEVGVHGLHHDHKMFLSESTFRHYANHINEYLKTWNSVGFRAPAMFHNLSWFHYLNIRYDSSTFDTDPFEPQPDSLRTIFPLVIYSKGNTEGYVELPYTLPQDHTLFVVLQESTTNIWKQKLDWIVQNEGMALLNVHPDFLAMGGRQLAGEYRQELYWEFLNCVRDRYKDRYWNALPKEIADFWIKICAISGFTSHDQRRSMMVE